MITPDQDSGSIRLLNLMRILRSEGHHVVFLAENLEGNAKYRYPLEALGIEVLYDAWAGSVRQTLRERGREFDVVMLCRHYVASAHLADVRLYAPKAHVVFDSVDLHFLREEREAALSGDADAVKRAHKTRTDELQVVASADVTLVVSEVERSLLNELAPTAKVTIVSNIHDAIAHRAGFNQRNGVLFVGGFRHPPNIDAVKWYAEEILPRVRALNPTIVSKIVGSNMPPEVASLARDGLEILGPVPDLRPLLEQSRVSIAPLRYGAGVKGKINEAMNFGMPVVATALAVEGMHLTHDIDCLVADDPETFAAHIVELHSNAEHWARIASAGIVSVERHFSFDAVRPHFLRALGLVADAN
jgi:O-antigen biosynthesis protein